MCPSLHWRKEGPHGLVCAIDLKGGKRQDISPALCCFYSFSELASLGLVERMKRCGVERERESFPQSPSVWHLNRGISETKALSSQEEALCVCVCAHVFVCESCLLFLALDLRCYPKCAGLWIWAIPPPDWEFCCDTWAFNTEEK